MAKKRFAQVGTGGRARFFYHAVASTYKETSELVAFCDVNQTRMDYANSYLESVGTPKVPTYKHYEFDKMIEEIIRDVVAPSGKPIFMGLQSGHCVPKLTLPFGTRCRIDADACTLTVLESAVREA